MHRHRHGHIVMVGIIEWCCKYDGAKIGLVLYAHNAKYLTLILILVLWIGLEITCLFDFNFAYISRLFRSFFFYILSHPRPTNTRHCFCAILRNRFYSLIYGKESSFNHSHIIYPIERLKEHLEWSHLMEMDLNGGHSQMSSHTQNVIENDIYFLY